MVGHSVFCYILVYAACIFTVALLHDDAVGTQALGETIGFQVDSKSRPTDMAVILGL